MALFPDYSYRPAAKNPYFLGGFGLIALGLYKNWSADKPVSMETELSPAAFSGDFSLLVSNLTESQAAAFKNAIPQRAKPYAEMFVRAGRAAGVSPFILTAIMQRESGFGAGCRMPACQSGDRHGWGLMQVDDRFHKAFINSKVNGRPAYEDPWSSIEYGANLFAQYQRSLDGFMDLKGIDLLRATAASYNAGPGSVKKVMRKGKSPDAATTGKDYGRYVLTAASKYLDAAKSGTTVG